MRRSICGVSISCKSAAFANRNRRSASVGRCRRFPTALRSFLPKRFLQEQEEVPLARPVQELSSAPRCAFLLLGFGFLAPWDVLVCDVLTPGCPVPQGDRGPAAGLRVRREIPAPGLGLVESQSLSRLLFLC